MPITSKIDESKQLTIYTVTGRTTLDDFFFEIETFYKGKPTKNVLWDLTQAALYNISAKDAEILSSSPLRFNNRRNGGRTAFVALEKHIINLAQYFKNYGDMDKVPIDVKVFEKIDDAYQWMDL